MPRNSSRASDEGGSPDQVLLMDLIRLIVKDDVAGVAELIETSPHVARERLMIGATRQTAREFYFKDIEHYLIAGDTLLHAAAAGYRNEIARRLIEGGADVSARNRRGAGPLHYAADGGPASRVWNGREQARMIALLIDAGAKPDELDKSGVAPLHRAVRQRCTGAVECLLREGADVGLKNKSGSTPLHLAVQNTGRGGTGSAESKACQREIIRLLLKAGANARERDGRGRTVLECARSDWIREVLERW